MLYISPFSSLQILCHISLLGLKEWQCSSKPSAFVKMWNIIYFTELEMSRGAVLLETVEILDV
jgi:hypothetical protein